LEVAVIEFLKATLHPSVEMLLVATIMSILSTIRDGNITSGQLSMCLSGNLRAVSNQPSVVTAEGDTATTDQLTIDMNLVLKDMIHAKATPTMTINVESRIEAGTPRLTKMIVVELQFEMKAPNTIPLLFVKLTSANVSVPVLQMIALRLQCAPAIANVF
jgi:hypothetical protein